MSLSRDVLKWLQSLDLTWPIKHPRRDFANGYLVAEIFARFYPGQLLIPCFYTGNSTLQKRKNWDQLEKFFRNNEINIPKDAIHAVMECHPEAAVLFIENTYTLLTGRSVLKAPPSEGSSIPHFALPTTSTLIRSVAENPIKARLVIIDSYSRPKSSMKRTMNMKKCLDASSFAERKKMEEKEKNKLRQLAQSLLRKGKLSSESKALSKSDERLRKSLPILAPANDATEPAYYKHIMVKQSH